VLQPISFFLRNLFDHGAQLDRAHDRLFVVPVERSMDVPKGDG
jgi:hypothetical protein